MLKGNYYSKYNSSIRQQIWRRIHILKQNGISRRVIIDILEFEENGMVDLRKLFISLQKKGMTSIQNNFVRTGTHELINSKNSILVDLDYFVMKDLYFQKIDSMDQRSQTNYSQKQQNQIKNKQLQVLSNSQQSQQKKKVRIKQPQRKLIDVIRKVKYWRILSQIDHRSLRDAAKIVGVSKKSLDDYYLVLRNAEHCGFDFQSNLENGVGRVRAYIKKYNPRKEGRLPKEISNYNFFGLLKDQSLLNYNNDESKDSLCCYKIQQSDDE